MARVNWSFPEDVSPELSDFILSVKAEGDDKVICLKNTAAVNRSDTLTNLKPGKRYTVAVAAHYKDGIEKMREVEHEIVGKSNSMYKTIHSPQYLTVMRNKLEKGQLH